MLFLSRGARNFGLLVTVAGASFGLAAVGMNLAYATESSSSTSIPSPSADTSASPPAFASGSVPELNIGQLPSIRTWKDISLPVNHYREDQGVRNEVLTAEYQETKRCAAQYGVAFNVAAPTRPVTAENTDYHRLFGLIDSAAARAYGYHSGEELQKDGESVPTHQATADPSESAPNYFEVVMGDPAGTTVNGLTVPAGGCIAEARSKFGDSAQTDDLYETAIGYGLSQSDRDPRVIKAFASWSACMRTAGYSYATPVEANNDPQFASSTVSATEIATATADVNCKTQTNLTALRVAVAAAWQNKFIIAHGAQFGAMQSNFREQFARAQSTLTH